MSENTQVLLAIWAFWIALITLDLFALWSLRRRTLPATATILWVIWIIVAPVIGAASYFIVRPRRMECDPSSG